MKLHTFKMGGVHPAENKIAAGKAIENLPLPVEVVLPVAQHIGAPAKPIVKKGDKVKRGDCVAEAGGFVSAPIHSPISGTVTKIDTCRTPQGVSVEAIYIKSDDADRAADAEALEKRNTPARSENEIAALDGKQIIDIIKNAGIVVTSTKFSAKIAVRAREMRPKKLMPCPLLSCGQLYLSGIGSAPPGIPAPKSLRRGRRSWQGRWAAPDGPEWRRRPAVPG